MTEQSVLCETVETQTGALIGHISLNKPSALNAIDLAMVKAIDAQLIEWQHNPNLVCVVLDSVGDKAFCAGGDVVSMYNAMAQEPGKTPEFLEQFFSCEYQLDHRIHTYPKPIIVWGKGILMGGGLGLFNGASHRVVTATSRIAMPEITIGLYPDVGGTWFLNRMPGNTGLFLGLTGASINATDALYTDLADYFAGNYSSDDCLDALKRQPWPEANADEDARTEIEQLVNDVLATFNHESHSQLPNGHLKALQATIDSACSAGSLQAIVDNILALPSDDDKWLSKAQKSLAHGSTITAHIVYRQLMQGASLALADCFKMELDLSCRCGEFGEFAEGVRALLIDKDMQPDWRYKSVDAVPADVIDWFFSSPWSAENHPLATLGEK